MKLIKKYLGVESFQNNNSNIRQVSSDNHIKASDYGFCLIGSYFLENDIHKLFNANLFVSNDLIRGNIDEVMK